MAEKYVDTKGKELPYDTVKDIAFENIYASLSKSDLVDNYINLIGKEELLEWATNTHGEFVDA